MKCKLKPLTPPRIVASGKAKNVTPTYAFKDPTLPGPAPKYGQDLTFGVGRTPPVMKRGGIPILLPPMTGRPDVGKTEAVLKPKMKRLRDIFAKEDKKGIAKRLFAQFLAKQRKVTYFDDADLNAVAAAHDSVRDWRVKALVRIHQALKEARWEVTKLVAPTDLGVPDFNKGSKWFRTGDWNNGLALMINGGQYAYAIATHHGVLEEPDCMYCVTLRFVFYDVFGLDDIDLQTFGAIRDAWGTLTHSVHGAPIGITAWWQLQHQHAYAPLVTRIVLQNTYQLPME
jgi:hypothetical protein